MLIAKNRWHFFGLFQHFYREKQKTFRPLRSAAIPKIAHCKRIFLFQLTSKVSRWMCWFVCRRSRRNGSQPNRIAFESGERNNIPAEKSHISSVRLSSVWNLWTWIHNHVYRTFSYSQKFIIHLANFPFNEIHCHCKEFSLSRVCNAWLFTFIENRFINCVVVVIVVVVMIHQFFRFKTWKAQ